MVLYTTPCFLRYTKTAFHDDGNHKRVLSLLNTTMRPRR